MSESEIKALQEELRKMKRIEVEERLELELPRTLRALLKLYYSEERPSSNTEYRIGIIEKLLADRG